MDQSEIGSPGGKKRLINEKGLSADDIDDIRSVQALYALIYFLWKYFS